MKSIVLRLGLVAFAFFLTVVSWSDSDMGRDKAIDIYAIYKAVNNAGFGPEWKYNRKGNVYVFVTVGAGYVDLSGITLYWEYSRFRNDLNAAVRASGESVHETSYGVVKPSYAIANMLIGKPRYGVTDIDNHFRLGMFVAELKARGWNPYVLLRVPKYASCKSSNVVINNLPTRVRPRYVWYNATNMPKDAAIDVSASVSPGLSAFLIYIKFILPGIGLLAALVGLYLGLNHRIHVKTRSLVYDWGLFIGVSTLITGIVSGCAFHCSLFGRIVVDMWLANPGNPDNRSSAGLLWGYGILLLTVLIVLFLKTRIIRDQDDKPDLEDIDVMVARIRKSVKIVVGICLGFFAFLFIARPFELWNIYFRFEYLGGVLAVILSRQLERLWERDPYKPFSKHEELTLRAKELAMKMGVDLNEVRVVTSDRAKTIVSGSALVAKKIVYITQQATEVLAPCQMDFLLGHELAHFKNDQYKQKTMIKIGLYSILVLAFSIAFTIMFTYITSLVVLWLVGLLFAASLFPFVYLDGFHRRLEHEADIQAILLTGNVDTAISALETMYGSNSKVDTDDDTGIHPKLAKRIKAMRIAGEKLNAES